jgi:lipopolysaccharide/colanic/teichoic acid biosynthesis glycosyltransferase
VFATVLLVVISPLLVVIGLVVLATSGRPVLFRQNRVGRHGKVFSILKFRTMVADAERIGGGYTPEGANLITPVGRLLRASSLNELPQFVNIVRGEMALIGPRPSLVDQYRRYTTFQLRRTEVLPQITGLAQVITATTRHGASASSSMWSTSTEPVRPLTPRYTFARSGESFPGPARTRPLARSTT